MQPEETASNAHPMLSESPETQSLPGRGDWHGGSESTGRISYKVTIAGIEFEVRFDGKHLNLHLYGEDQIWQFEPLETALPKLEALTKVARLAQEATT